VVLGVTGRVKLRWLDKKTGETGVYVEPPCGHGSVSPDEDEPGGWCLFLWQEGNYSCDCNRAPFFTHDDVECGGSRFRILEAWVTPEDTPLGLEIWMPLPGLAEE
jgi:hypothetical protein